MSDLAILGGGAYGTALALTQAAAGRRVTLWARDLSGVTGRTMPRLPDHPLPDTITLTDDLAQIAAETLLLAVPMQGLGTLAAQIAPGPTLIACCKGIDLRTGLGPTAVLSQAGHDRTAVLTGPSFAVDIANGLPTALTLAGADADLITSLQPQIATQTLRLYRSPDPLGAELGGALKNVVAIACGVTQGLGLGDSARAAVMTRGFAELNRYAQGQGALPQTLMGLSGMGDLVLTCSSTQSRNFAHGVALGRGQGIDPTRTVEGVATARALVKHAGPNGAEMPLTQMVDRLCQGQITPRAAQEALLARPLKEE